MPARRTTAKAKGLVDQLRALDREARAELVDLLNEEDTLARVGGSNTSDLTKKYNLDSMGNGPLKES